MLLSPIWTILVDNCYTKCRVYFNNGFSEQVYIYLFKLGRITSQVWAWKKTQV